MVAVDVDVDEEDTSDVGALELGEAVVDVGWVESVVAEAEVDEARGLADDEVGLDVVGRFPGNVVDVLEDWVLLLRGAYEDCVSRSRCASDRWV